jgi:hypothetical protein
MTVPGISAGSMSAQCRVVLQLRTFRGTARTDERYVAEQNLGVVIFLSIVFRNIVGNESNHDHFAKRHHRPQLAD